GLRVPELHRLVGGGAGQAAAVRAPAHAQDPACVPLEGAQVGVAESVEVAPLPVAPLLRHADLQDVVGTLDLIFAPGAVSPLDPPEVAQPLPPRSFCRLPASGVINFSQ